MKIEITKTGFYYLKNQDGDIVAKGDYGVSLPVSLEKGYQLIDVNNKDELDLISIDTQKVEEKDSYIDGLIEKAKAKVIDGKDLSEILLYLLSKKKPGNQNIAWNDMTILERLKNSFRA